MQLRAGNPSLVLALYQTDGISAIVGLDLAFTIVALLRRLRRIPRTAIFPCRLILGVVIAIIHVPSACFASPLGDGCASGSRRTRKWHGGLDLHVVWLVLL